jgi:hypothetical protein
MSTHFLKYFSPCRYETQMAGAALGAPLRVGGRFMNGYTRADDPAELYSQDNPQGLEPNTAMWMIRTGFNFKRREL